MPLVDIVLHVTLGLILFGVGTSTTWQHFGDTLKRPKALILGISLQMVFLPLVAFLMIYWSDLPVAYKVGIHLVSLCPGGSTSNFVSYLLQANVALSVSMTSINSLLILLTLPLLLPLGMNLLGGPEASVSGMVLWSETSLILLSLLAPAFLGTWVGNKYPDWTARWSRWIKYISTALLAGVFLVKIMEGGDSADTGTSIEYGVLIPWCLGLQLLTMLSAMIIARISGLISRSQVTIGIEVGLQNTGLALLLASRFFEDTAFGHPALVVALFSFGSTLLVGYLALYFLAEAE